MDKGREDTKGTCKNVNIKAGIVKITFKQKTPFYYKAEIFTERKIRKGVINKKQAKSCYRHPEQHLEKNLRRLLKGEYSCVLHTVV